MFVDYFELFPVSLSARWLNGRGHVCHMMGVAALGNIPPIA